MVVLKVMLSKKRHLAEDTMPDNDSALSLIRAALGQEVEDLAIAGKVKEYSSQDYELNDLARSLAGKLPEEVVRQVYNGKLQSPLVTLDTALSGYAAYKAEEGAREKDAALRIKKLRNDLKGCLGGHKLGKGGLAGITRADANAFRDHLLERMKRLRTVITDRNLTMHSLRHRMKDGLRNTGCPQAVSMAILGHGSNTVAANTIRATPRRS